jgi:hypothetical protein
VVEVADWREASECLVRPAKQASKAKQSNLEERRRRR